MGEAILHQKIGRLLVANRGEIAIRIVRAARELQMRTVAIFSEEDRGARHRFTADESYLVGKGRTPVDAYLDLDDVLRVLHPRDELRGGSLRFNPGTVRAWYEDGRRTAREVSTRLGRRGRSGSSPV